MMERAARLGSLEKAQIEEAVECEWAERLPDLLHVSTYWGYERRWDRTAWAGLAAEMGSRLGWSEGRREEEVTRMAEGT